MLLVSFSNAFYISDIAQLDLEDFIDLTEAEIYAYFNIYTDFYSVDYTTNDLEITFKIPNIEARDGQYFLIYEGVVTTMSYYTIDACFELYPYPSPACFNNLINNENEFYILYEGYTYAISPIIYQLVTKVNLEVSKILELQNKINREQLYNNLYNSGAIEIPIF